MFSFRPLVIALLVLLATASSLDGRSAPATQRGTLIDTPYFAQTPLLCGGAALAMVLRYWGDPSALPQDFASLVDEAAGGIAASRLAAAATARGWQSLPTRSSMADAFDGLARQVAQGRPVIALIEDSPGTFHYVVVVGITDDSVVVHDPARSPYIVWRVDEFERRWSAASRWMLLVLPATSATAADTPAAVSAAVAEDAAIVGTSRSGPTAPAAVSPCDALVARGVRAAAHDTDTAERMLRSAVSLCPGHAAPLRELAGLRLVQGQWAQSISFAEQALTIDPADRHAIEVLATSRFASGDAAGALRAWNLANRPGIDTITIHGLRRTHQPVVLALMGLQPGRHLRAADFARAERRLDELPTVARTALRYNPIDDGRASLDAVATERRLLPSGWIGWSSVGIHALITREARVDIAAPFSQGDRWQLGFRWPRERRRLGLNLSLPTPGGRPGVFNMEVLAERQTYGPTTSVAGSSDATRSRIGLSYADWLPVPVRVELGIAGDRHDSSRYLALRAAATSHLPGDLTAGHLAFERWTGTRADSPAFHRFDAVVEWRSTPVRDARTWTGRAGVAVASRHAPLATWPGAGTTLDRTALMRARRLVIDEVIAGEMFGRRLAFATVERQHPVWQSAYGNVALAGFVDAARTWQRATDDSSRLLIDAGGGVRIRRAGDDTQIRIDLGVGLRDGRVRVSAGYVTAWGRH